MLKRRGGVVLVVVVTAVITWLGVATAAQPDRIAICHKPGTPDEHTLTLPAVAAENHVRSHGDTVGACPADTIAETTVVETTAVETTAVETTAVAT